MNRSPGDTSRRRALADVAGGFPARASVVLYACIPPGQEQDDIAMRLRRHAEARDWVVVGEVFDHTPTATPLEQRTNWSQARAYITTGQARGIVTTSRTTCAQTSGSSTLMEWLRDQHAFLSEDSPTEAGAAR